MFRHARRPPAALRVLRPRTSHPVAQKEGDCLCRQPFEKNSCLHVTQNVIALVHIHTRRLGK